MTLINEPFRILIAGLGGVGGCFGGRLAKYYENDSRVEICFFARGNHLEKIKQDGIIVETNSESFIGIPTIASDLSSSFGKVNLIVFCTKTYDLALISSQLEQCITSDTVLLPYMNGVDGYEFLKKNFPKNTVLNGCAYIISMIKSPGVIANIGNIERFYFGNENQTDSLVQLERMFQLAGIDAHYSTEINEIVWEKFVFISAIASATSYYSSSSGEILQDDKKRNFLVELIAEVCEVAKLKGIEFQENIEEQTLSKIEKMPFETKTSMSRDFEQGKKTELQSLTKYVLNEGQGFNLPMNAYLEVYTKLKS